MPEVEIEMVDERDSGWEDSNPRFRVYLHGSGATSTGGWTATYDITGADVLQVLEWAQRQAGNTRTYAVALVYDDEARGLLDPEGGRGLVWLAGMDGNDHAPDDPRTVETQRRMLLRRGVPVELPETDRMPAGVPDVPSEVIARLDAAQPTGWLPHVVDEPQGDDDPADGDA